MGPDRLSPIPQTSDLIKSDIVSGGRAVFDRVTQILKERSGTEDDLLTLSGTNMVQVDIGVGTDTIYRLQLGKFDGKEGESKDLNIWRVNEEGFPIGNMYTLFNYYGNDGFKTFINGSSRGSIDGGDLDIEPWQLADYLDDALGRVNEYNWRLVVGRENVPEGKI